MTHAGKEIRFREVGLLRGGLGALQFDVGSWSACSLRLRSVTSRATANTPCSVLFVVEGGGVVGYLCFLAIPGARGEFVVGDFLFAQHQLDGRSARSGSVK